LLIEEYPLLSIPGESRIYVHEFSLEGNLLNSSGFSSGWRIGLTDMEVTHIPEIGRKVLVVNSLPSINGRDVAKQYYALIGEKVTLIRLEDSNGRLIRNHYGFAGHPIGPTMSGRSAEEWEKALKSDDIADQLAVLMWLGGGHWNIHKYVPEYGRGDWDEDQRTDEVRSGKVFKEVQRRMSLSENVWVQTATELALKPEYYNANYKD
jgi:hypothetical protein